MFPLFSIPSYQKKQDGFTIVELLIVIVVIGILAAITVVAYNGVQTRATDSIRRSDINSVRKAIEAEHAETGQYPLAGNGSSTCLSAPHWVCWGFTPETRFVRADYLQKMPQDPKYFDSAACNFPNSFATRAYYYSVTVDRQGYTVGAFLENVSTSDPNYLAPANRGCGSFMNWGYVKG